MEVAQRKSDAVVRWGLYAASPKDRTYVSYVASEPETPVPLSFEL